MGKLTKTDVKEQTVKTLKAAEQMALAGVRLFEALTRAIESEPLGPDTGPNDSKSSNSKILLEAARELGYRYNAIDM